MRQQKVIRIGRGCERNCRTRNFRADPRQGMMFRAPFSFRAAELRALTDEALMQRVDHADALAFEVIFDRHGGAAFSLAYRMCGRRTIAEDIVQETFLSLWRRGGRYERGQGRRAVLGARRGSQQGDRLLPPRNRHHQPRCERGRCARGAGRHRTAPTPRLSGARRRAWCVARSIDSRPSSGA